LTATTGYVTTWYDQAGSYNATQTTAGNQPLYVSQADGLDFGGDDWLTTTIVPAMTWSATIKVSDVSATNGVAFGAYVSETDSFGIRPYYLSISTFFNGGISQAEFFVAGILGLAGKTPYINGVAQTAIAEGGSTTGTMGIGARDDGALAFNGRVSELVLANATWSDANMILVSTIMGA
jgi:hypothetical protein